MVKKDATTGKYQNKWIALLTQIAKATFYIYCIFFFFFLEKIKKNSNKVFSFLFRKSISQPQFPSQSSGRGDCGSSESWQWAAPGAAVPCRGGAEAEFDQRRIRLPPFLPTAPSPPTLSFPRPVQQVTRCVRESLFYNEVSPNQFQVTGLFVTYSTHAFRADEMRMWDKIKDKQ